ncbi:elongation factor G [Desulforhabdus amnigena]|uniref:Elongation factor G n=1 Tax=Desulforhabdus amnigena TaxID=40218 RepID=A0A9W6FRE8_9BACT|nr:elongation factor G [Desulforhabdus amnigena]NLJ29795.1 elongation factor G [Deltaproteobacteria bacterium]GLI33482.1 elongation factor G [Desulforhabdus amnigena]
MKDEIKSVRTFAIISHGGAGKTSLAEAMLFNAGVTTRLGKVDENTSIMDYEPEEIKRKITISTAFNTFTWKKHQLTVIDTPGDFNFIAETKTSMQGADAVLVLTDAIDGVRVQTEKVWEFANEMNQPRIIFVSKIDRERADFFKTVEDIQGNFGKSCVPLQVPIGVAENFKGIVDILTGKAYYFNKGESGEFEIQDMPSELADQVAQYKEELVERVAESNDALLEKYLEEGELSPEEVKNGLRGAVVSQKLVPITCGSGTGNLAIQPLMDLIVDCFPSPLDRGEKSGMNAQGDAEVIRQPAADAPFSALVIKTISDPYAGRLSVMRIFSGTLAPDSTVYNSTKGCKERFGQLLRLKGKNQEPLQIAGPGDIVAVAKLKETTTQDTLCSEKDIIVFPPVELPPAIYSLAVEPKSKGDEEKIFSSLSRLMEEDLTLKLERKEDTKEMILSGMGEIHIEATIDKLKRKFGVEVNLTLPKVTYKETIKGKTRVQGKYKKQSGGRGQYGDCWIEMEPLPRGEGFQFYDKIVGGVIPKQYIPAVEKGIAEALPEGPLAGYPVVDFKVDLVDGSFHPVDSSEMAFKIAGSMAFKKAVMEAKPTLLEPIMLMEITVPDDCMGDVIGDLNSRRGRVLGMESKGKKQIVKANVPLAEVLKYAPDLRSMTAGRGMFTMKFSHYEEVPGQLQEKIIEASKQEEK